MINVPNNSSGSNTLADILITEHLVGGNDFTKGSNIFTNSSYSVPHRTPNNFTFGDLNDSPSAKLIFSCLVFHLQRLKPPCFIRDLAF